MVCECAATTRTRPDGGAGASEAAERRMESRRSGGLRLHVSLPPSRHRRGGRWGDGDPEACPGAWAQWEWGAGGTTLVPHTTQPETSHHGPHVRPDGSTAPGDRAHLESEPLSFCSSFELRFLF